MEKHPYTLEPVSGTSEQCIAVYEGGITMEKLDLDFNKPGIFGAHESNIVGMRVKGDLIIKGSIVNEEDIENSPSLTVDGSIKADRLLLGSSEIVVKGNVDIQKEFIACYNHGSMKVAGNLSAKIVAAEYPPAVKVQGKIDGYVAEDLVYLYTKGKKDERKIYSHKGIFIDSLVKAGNVDYRSAIKKLIKDKPILKDAFVTIQEETKKLLGKKLENPLAVKSLNLYLKPLPIFPTEIFLFTNLEDLNLESTNIHSVPKEIGQLKNLKKLNLRGNGLTEIPEEIGELKNLEYLNLQANCITGLPSGLAGCTALKELDLSNNPYSYIAKVFGSWSKIKAMYEFPEILTELPSLETFCIDQTLIKNLPRKSFKSTVLKPIEIKQTLIPVKSSAFHPQLRINTDKNIDWALSHIDFWTGRWDAVHKLLLEKKWQEAVAVYELLMDILIPITAPYDKAWEQMHEKLSDVIQYKMNTVNFQQAFPDGFTPFFKVLKERMTALESKYPQNKLIKNLVEYCNLVENSSI